MKKNCWEEKECGREPGGSKTAEFGVCPAAESSEYDGKNSGKFAGRYCWKVGGTLCGGVVQGSFAFKITNCSSCPFFHKVREEEDKFEL
ncbi:MAG: hypothetical protein GY757_61425 [bacterium]|nr:hypothetical protein [bacterium]